MLRVTTLLTGGPGGNQYSSQYFGGSTEGEALIAQDVVGDFWQSLNISIDTSYNAILPTAVELVDPASGQIINEFPAPPRTVDMTATAEPLPWATQLLCRLRTSTFVAGRRLQGRIFIPGMNEANSQAGVPTTAYRTAIQGALDTLVSTSVGAGALGVYSRTHGTFAPVTSTSVWEKWAVLRSRRE